MCKCREMILFIAAQHKLNRYRGPLAAAGNGGKRAKTSRRVAWNKGNDSIKFQRCAHISSLEINLFDAYHSELNCILLRRLGALVIKIYERQALYSILDWKTKEERLLK